MTQSKGDTQTSVQDVALIVGGGPGTSSSCAKLFAENGMRVGVAARNPDKPVLQTPEKTHDVRRYACAAAQPAAVALRFAEAGEGASVNISSVVGLALEFGMSVYGAARAFVTFLSAQPRARPQGRLCPGGAARRDPYRDLGTCQHRRQSASRGRAG